MYKTPSLNFNPSFSLGGEECSVYLHEDDIYVTDFLSAKKTKNRIFKDVEPISDDIIK